MQCKDIDEKPILEFLANMPLENGHRRWANWFGEGFDNSVPRPEGVPDKLMIAKMAQMIKKGLVDGCPCGCRGDYVITEKGLSQLSAASSAPQKQLNE